MSGRTYTYTMTFNEIRFADPYKKCVECGGWVDGVILHQKHWLDDPESACGGHNLPCAHHGYIDLCPSWSPVDGCRCPVGAHAEREVTDR